MRILLAALCAFVVGFSATAPDVAAEGQATTKRTCSGFRALLGSCPPVTAPAPPVTAAPPVAPAPPSPAFDFSLTNGGIVTLPQLSAGGTMITATLQSGSAQQITLSVSGLPSEVTSSFSQGTCAPTCFSTLNMATGGSAPVGSYLITVKAASGNVSHSTNFTLTVTAPAAAPVSAAASQTSISTLVKGDRVQVKKGSVALNILDGINGKFLGLQPELAVGTVTGSPQSSGGRNWVYVDYDTGVDGWSTDGSLVKVSAGTQPSSTSPSSSPPTSTPTVTPTTATFDFSLTNNGSKSVNPGQQAVNGITATQTLNGASAQAITFTTSGLPSGTTYSYAPGSCTVNCSTTMSINTSSSTPAGTYTITVSATGGGTTKQTSFTLSVVTAGTAANGTYYVSSGKAHDNGGNPNSIHSGPIGPVGDDSNPGTLDKPFKTLQKAIPLLKPGDTLIIRGGEYDTGANGLDGLAGSGSNSIIPSGTSWAQPVTLKANPGETPVFRRYAAPGVDEYAMAHSIRMPSADECEAWAKDTYGDKWQQNYKSYPYDCWAGGPGGTGIPGKNFLYVIEPHGEVGGYVLNMSNDFEHPVQYVIFDGIAFDARGISNGITFWLAATHIRFMNGEIANSIKSCMSQPLGGYDDNAAREINADLQFINMKMHHCGVPYFTEGNPNRDYYGLRFFHPWYAHTGGNLCDGCETWKNAGTGIGPDGNNNIIRNSYFHDNNAQGIISGGTGWQIYNNVFYNNGGNDISINGSVHVYNNTVVAGPRAGGMGQGIFLADYAGGSVIENNIVYGYYNGIFNQSMNSTPNIVRNNLVVASYHQIYDGDWPDWHSVHMVQENNIVGQDPKFVDAAHEDFRLQPGSPAINNGYATGVLSDRAGCARNDGKIDIGAYEYTTTCSAPPPTQTAAFATTPTASPAPVTAPVNTTLAPAQSSSASSTATPAATVSSSSSSALAKGDRVQVKKGSIALNVRDGANGNVIDQQPELATGTVTGTPQFVGGKNWVYVDYDTGVDGWSTDGSLIKIAGSISGTPPPVTSNAVAPTPVVAQSSSSNSASLSPASTLQASYLGLTGEDKVGQMNQTTGNGKPDFHISVAGLRGTPTKTTITSNTGGVWEIPFNGSNWIIATQYSGSNGDLWFEQYASNKFHVKVRYVDGTTDEVDAVNNAVSPQAVAPVQAATPTASVPVSNGVLPYDRTSPVIYDNDGAIESGFTDEYIMALASAGVIDLRGIISTGTNGEQPPYTPRPEDNIILERQEMVAKARRSGLRNLPDVSPGPGVSMSSRRPASGRIEDTPAFGSKGARLIVSEAHKATPEKPLVVVLGGQGSVVADAYLLDNSIADKVMVAWLVGNRRSSNGLLDAYEYNAYVDSWATYIIFDRLRVVVFPVDDAAIAAVPKSRLYELPNTELRQFMLENRWPTGGGKYWEEAEDSHVWDVEGAIPLTRPDYVTSTKRLSFSHWEADNWGGKYQLPVWKEDPNGRTIIVMQASPTVATAEWWARMKDPAAWGASQGEVPFNGTPWPVPGTIEAENFDFGGTNVSYYDNTNNWTKEEWFNPIRFLEHVDIQASTSASGGYKVWSAESGEWMKYTVTVGSTNTYTLQIAVASNGGGGTFHVEFDGVDKTGPITLPNTGGWDSWQIVTKSGINLSSGKQVMRLVMDSNGGTNQVGHFDYFKLTSTNGSTVAQTTTPAQATSNTPSSTNIQTAGSPSASTPAPSSGAIPTSGLVGYWSFDDGTATDQSGTGNKGTLVNTPTVLTGKVGNALSFNGSNAYVRIEDSASLDLSNALTLSFWVKFNTMPTGTTAMSPVTKTENAAYGIIANESGSGRMETYFSVNGSYVLAGESLSNLSPGQWYHFVGTFDGTTTKFYRDGSLKQSLTQAGSIMTNNEPLTIGANPDSQGLNFLEFFNGAIDEVRVYNRALSAQEVANLYMAENQGVASLTVAIPAPNITAPSSTLQASYLGVTGEDKVGQMNQTTPNGKADFHISVAGLRGTPNKVTITSNTGGTWETPFNGTNWIVATQYSGTSGDLWFEQYSSNKFHVKVRYADGTNDEADAANNAVAAPVQTAPLPAPAAATFDFSLTNTGSKSVNPGGSAVNSITVTQVLNGAGSQNVSFSASGLPSGASSTLNSSSCSPNCSSVLTINTGGSTPGGSYPITVTVSGGGTSRTTSFTLSVVAPGQVVTGTYYVSSGVHGVDANGQPIPAGDDKNSGTDINHPFKTIWHAVQVLKAGETLLVRGGEYDTVNGLTCDVTHPLTKDCPVHGDYLIPSGASWDKPVTVKGYPGDLTKAYADDPAQRPNDTPRPIFRRFVASTVANGGGFVYDPSATDYQMARVSPGHMPLYEECVAWWDTHPPQGRNFPHDCWDGSGNQITGLWWQAGAYGSLGGAVVNATGRWRAVQYIILDGIDLDALGTATNTLTHSCYQHCGENGDSDYDGPRHMRYQNMEIRNSLASCHSNPGVDERVIEDFQFINVKIHHCGVPFDTHTVGAFLAREHPEARFYHPWYMHGAGNLCDGCETYKSAGTGLGPAGLGNIIRNSFVHDNTVQGIIAFADWQIYNNIFSNNGGHDIQYEGGPLHVYNNTFIAGPREANGSAILMNNGGGLVFENNIVYGYNYGIFNQSQDSTPNIVRSNLVYVNPSIGRDIYNGDWPDWHSTPMVQQNNIVGQDPKFVSTDPASPDFAKLQPSSPAIGKGIATGLDPNYSNCAVRSGKIDIGSIRTCTAPLPSPTQ